MQFSTEVIGQCNPSLTLCPKCPSDRHASSWEYSPRFSWGLSLFCSQCDTMWMVCRKCPKLRNRFRSGSEMLRHNKKRHANESRPSPSSRLSPSSHPSSSGGKRSIAEVEEAVAAVVLPPFPDVLPAVSDQAEVMLPPFPDVLPAISDVTCGYVDENTNAAHVPDYVTMSGALLCSVFGKTLLDDAVFHGLDKDSYIFDGLVNENSLSTFPAGNSKGDVLDEAFPIVAANSSVGVHHSSPSSPSSKGMVESSNNNAVSSLLLLATEGMQSLPASPPPCNIALLPYIFEVPPYDADSSAVVTYPEFLSEFPLRHDIDNGVFFIPSILSDDFMRRLDHRMMVIKIPKIDIIEEFYCNFQRIPESKFQYISETKLKQFTFEREYGTICGSNGMLWDKFLELFQPRSKDCKLRYLSHIDFEQVYGTAIYTNALMPEPQRPHVDFTWEVLLLASRRRRGVLDRDNNCQGLKHGNMPYTGHMPLSSEGSYIYVWPGPGQSVCIHIRYGSILFMRGDIVHCGGTPKNGFCADKKYPRLHFYLLTSPADLPNNNVFYYGYDGEPFDKDHYHQEY